MFLKADKKKHLALLGVTDINTRLLADPCSDTQSLRELFERSLLRVIMISTKLAAIEPPKEDNKLIVNALLGRY